jgi:hypothetical protein
MSNFISGTRLTNKNGFAAAENTIARRMSVMETVAKPQAAVSFFDQEDDEAKKGPRCCPSLGPRITHCKRVEELCAIHKANVTMRFLFQTLIELKRKRAALMDKGAARRTYNRRFGG